MHDLKPKLRLHESNNKMLSSKVKLFRLEMKLKSIFQGILFVHNDAKIYPGFFEDEVK